MQILFVINKVVEYIYRRKLNFILTISILGITIYLLASTIQIYCDSAYYIYETKKTISQENAISVKVFWNTMDNEYFELFKEFDEHLREAYGNQYGRFMYFTTSYENISKKIETLYVDESIRDFCELSIVESVDIGNDATIIKGYVGSGIAKQYPIGTILTNTHTGSKIQIVGELAPGAKWITEPILSTQRAVISLDNYIFAQMDTSFFETDIMLYGNVFNSMYIKYSSPADAERIKTEIRDMATDSGIMCYCNTVNELIQKEKEENEDYMNSILNLVFFVIVIAISAYISAGLADIYSRHYELAVMYINNVSSLKIFIIILAENIIKSIIALGGVIFLYGRNLAYDKLYVFETMVVPLLIVFVIVFMLIVSIINFSTINRKKILLLIGGSRR